MRSACTTNWCILFKKYANTAVSVSISLAHLRPDPHLLHPCNDSGSAESLRSEPPLASYQLACKTKLHSQSQRCRQCVALKCVLCVPFGNCMLCGFEQCRKLQSWMHCYCWWIPKAERTMNIYDLMFFWPCIIV